MSWRGRAITRPVPRPATAGLHLGRFTSCFRQARQHTTTTVTVVPPWPTFASTGGHGLGPMVGTPGDLGPAHRRRRTSLASPCAVSARLPPRSVRQQLVSLPTQTQVVGGRHIPEEPCHRTIDRTGYTQLPLTTKPYRLGGTVRTVWAGAIMYRERPGCPRGWDVGTHQPSEGRAAGEIAAAVSISSRSSAPKRHRRHTPGHASRPGYRIPDRLGD
jgi:hypothetical protein